MVIFRRHGVPSLVLQVSIKHSAQEALRMQGPLLLDSDART